MIHRVLAGLVVAAFLSACTSMPTGDRAAPSRIVMEEFMVAATDPGIELYVRNKHPEGMCVAEPLPAEP